MYSEQWLKVILSGQRLYGFGDQELSPLILQMKLREDEWLTQDNLSGWFPAPRWESWLSGQHAPHFAMLFHQSQALTSHNNGHLKHHNLNFLYIFYSVTPLIQFGLIKTILSLPTKINEKTPERKNNIFKMLRLK